MTPLVEGLRPEWSLLLTVAKVSLGLWALVLLLGGRLLPRLTVGSLFLAVSAALSWSAFSATSYPLALFVCWASFAFAMLVYAFAPRIAMAVACSWIFAGLYGAHIFYSGAFGLNKTLAFGLLAAGIAFGAILSRFGLAVLSSAFAAVLSLLALPYQGSFWWPAGVLAGGVLWQGLLLPKFGRERVTAHRPPPPTVPEKRRRWAGAMGWGAAVLALVLLGGSFLAPFPDTASAPQPKRVEAARKAGAFDRPGLLFSAEDAYYLFGRAMPVALFGPRGGLLDRFILPVLGCAPASRIKEMRTVKDAVELQKMRRAADITSKAFEEIAPLIKPGANEGDIEKAILASFEKNGATGIAFKCVVGSGKNATLPHYMDNCSDLKDGLIVIDIGCSFENYASDMTRTFPVRGTLTDPERKLVETVIAAGDAARAKLKAGVKYGELDSAARKVIKDAGFDEYFTHGLGHPVGLDVHDSWIRGPMKAGNVVTIEPGIYIPAGSKADKKYWDLGVRIEDSYLVTKDGYEELTHYPRNIGFPAGAELSASAPAASSAPTAGANPSAGATPPVNADPGSPAR